MCQYTLASRIYHIFSGTPYSLLESIPSFFLVFCIDYFLTYHRSVMLLSWFTICGVNPESEMNVYSILLLIFSFLHASASYPKKYFVTNYLFSNISLLLFFLFLIFLFLPVFIFLVTLLVTVWTLFLVLTVFYKVFIFISVHRVLVLFSVIQYILLCMYLPQL